MTVTLKVFESELSVQQGHCPPQLNIIQQRYDSHRP